MVKTQGKPQIWTVELLADSLIKIRFWIIPHQVIQPMHLIISDFFEFFTSVKSQYELIKCKLPLWIYGLPL